MEVQTAEDNGDVRVEHGAVGDVGEVLGLDVAAEGRVSASDVGYAFCLKFLLDSTLAHDEDFVLWSGELEDAGDVYGGAVGGSEDLVLIVV